MILRKPNTWDSLRYLEIPSHTFPYIICIHMLCSSIFSFHHGFTHDFTHGFTRFQPSPRVVDGSILFGRDFSRELRHDVHGRVLGLDL